MSQRLEKLKSLGTSIVTKIQTFVEDKETLKKYRTDPKHFSRDGKLPFNLTVQMTLSNMNNSGQVEIYKRFKINDLDTVMLSSYSKNRYKIDPLLFLDLFQQSVNIIDTEGKDVLRLWRGRRLRGIDGTTIILPDNPETREHFGQHKNGSKSGKISKTTMARVLLEEDLLNKTISRVTLAPITDSELALIYKWLLSANTTDDISILDRNFGCFSVMYLHYHAKKDFIVRMGMKSKVVKEFVASGATDEIVTFTASSTFNFGEISIAKGTQIKVRLIRVELSSGEVEVLATSLMDQTEYKTAEFGDLYHQRWGVETCIDVLKNKFGVMCFMAHKPEGIYQEVYATMLNYNVHQLLVGAAQDIVNEKVEKKKEAGTELKHEQKVNNSVTIGILIFGLLGLWRSKDTSKRVEELVPLFAHFTVPVRPGRSFKRQKSVAKRRNNITQTNYRRTG